MAYGGPNRDPRSRPCYMASRPRMEVKRSRTARVALSPYLRRIMLASASCSDAWAIIDADAFTLLFLQNEINHKDDRAEAAY